MRGVTTTAGLCLALLASGPVRAADIPNTRISLNALTAPTAYDWSGLYVGALGSAASGSSIFDFIPAGTSTGQFGLSGGVVGLTLGLNGQSGAMVYGFEGDINRARIAGSANCPGGPLRCETNTGWFGTLRGRMGYSFGRIMPYVTGGVAAGMLEANIPTVGSARAMRAGWVVGAGIEFALPGNLTAKAEYLYADMGRFDCGPACGASPVNVGFNAHLIRGGINYRF